MKKNNIEALLFDFDGTIADTSKDMIKSLNILFNKEGFSAIDEDFGKNFISKGAMALIDNSLKGYEIDADRKKNLLKQFLDIYKENLFLDTYVYAGLEEIFDFLNLNSIKWGIVTNKSSYFVNTIIEEIKFKIPPQCVVAGDTLNIKKPSPKPLLHAAKLLSCNPEKCLYIGDDQRDVEAGNAAGMKTIISSYGFISPSDNIKTWGANYIIEEPIDILKIVSDIND